LSAVPVFSAWRRALLLSCTLGVLPACHKPAGGGPDATPGPPIKMLKRTLVASKKTEVMPLAVGQWTRMRVKRPDENSMLTDKVIGKQGDAFWIETVLLRPGRKIITQALVAVKGAGSPPEVRELRVKLPDHKLQEYRGRQLRSAQLMYERLVESLQVPKLGAMPREGTHVPAGDFEGCYRRHVASKFRNINADATVWTHPAVPLSGTVKSLSDNKELTVELVDFGMTGAKSALQDR